MPCESMIIHSCRASERNNRGSLLIIDRTTHDENNFTSRIEEDNLNFTWIQENRLST